MGLSSHGYQAYLGYTIHNWFASFIYRTRVVVVGVVDGVRETGCLRGVDRGGFFRMDGFHLVIRCLSGI